MQCTGIHVTDNQYDTYYLYPRLKAVMMGGNSHGGWNTPELLTYKLALNMDQRFLCWLIAMLTIMAEHCG